MPWPVVLRALAHRNYRLFVAGQLTSLIGTWMQMVAQSWLVFRLTGSSLQLGLVGFSAQMPIFLLSPVGGGLADRFSRRNVLLLTQTAMMMLAFMLAALSLTGTVAHLARLRTVCPARRGQRHRHADAAVVRGRDGRQA